MHAAEEKTWWNKPGFHLSYMEDYPPYPYQRIKSEDGKDTGVVALIAPFYDLTYYRASHQSIVTWTAILCFVEFGFTLTHQEG